MHSGTFFFHICAIVRQLSVNTNFHRLPLTIPEEMHRKWFAFFLRANLKQVATPRCRDNGASGIRPGQSCVVSRSSNWPKEEGKKTGMGVETKKQLSRTCSKSLTALDIWLEVEGKRQLEPTGETLQLL